MRCSSSSPLVLAALLWASGALAQEVEVAGDDAGCPSRGAVAEALAKLVPSSRVVAHSEHAALSATVSDLGASYLVTTNGEKVIDDPRRRCDERARSAALVIALALDELPKPVATPIPVAAPQPTPPRVDSGPGPYALIDRPLVLPAGRALVKEELTISSAFVYDYPVAGLPTIAREEGATNVLAVDFGLGHRLQLGGWLAVPFDQGTGDISIVPHVLVDLHRDVALRVELGFDRSHYDFGPSNRGDINAAFVALTFLFRFRVHKLLALTIGDTGPRDEWPGQVGTISDLLPGASHSLLALVANRGATNVTMCLPVGLTFQPHRAVAIDAQVGPQLGFDRLGLQRASTAVPLSIDLVTTPTRRFDLGVSFAMPIYLSSPTALFQTSLFARLRL